ncbi:tenascin-like [Acanthaster planci]|uniref:Tenascin-like n=1 Tax=Acanthaster planci TaxID=133434 RepID=A0A8B7YWS2_ACAPL|nr:tenascin-like [Acanthaster planci]
MTSKHGTRRQWLVQCLAVFWTVVVYRPTLAVYLVGRPSSQTSTFKESTPAYKGVDGVPTSCAITRAAEHPWWRVDMLQEYCVGAITVVNRADCCAERLVGATVRAGLSPTISENTLCGSPVSAEQATPGAWLRFTCDPPVQARYVSVDIDLEGTGRTQFLTVCEVKVEESTAWDCHDWTANSTGFLDATCVTPTPLLDPSGDTGAFIGTYLGVQDATASVSFGRISQTGHTGNPALPTSALQVSHPLDATDAELLYLPRSGGLLRIGAFYCLARKDETTTKIAIIILHKNENIVHIRPVVLTKTINVMESATLEMRTVNPPTSDIRWRHNGGPFIDRSQGKLNHYIPSACLGDSGIYECHVNTFRPLQLHGIMKLIVRECPSGRWGPDVSCSKLCPPCYNGGICDAISGRCVCAPGFMGRYCEEVLGRDVFGQDGSHYCHGSDDSQSNGCRGKLFCLPDPYGCSCAAGFKGFDCMQECEEGTYGADCKQTCHCAPSVVCRKDTGECQGACAPSYFGVNCQQTACPVGFFGTECNQVCHCQSATCHRDSGECDGPCAESYFGVNCQETAYDGVPDLVAYPSGANPGHLILSWGKDSAAFYTIAYELVNRGHCQPITDPDRKFHPDRLDRNTSHFILTNLEPSSVYKVYVQSHYGIHSMLPAESFVVVSTFQANDSQVVKDFRVVDVTSSSFLLSWRPVQCATGYHVTSDLIQRGNCSRSEFPQERSAVMTPDTSVTIACTEPFATYNISILATVGDVNGSTSTLQVMSSPAAPGTPESLSLVSSTPSALHFAWNDLPCEEQHGHFHGYCFALRDTSTGDTVASDTTLVAEVGFSGLTPCRQYDFRVASTASGLQSPYSPWLNVQTAVQEPGPVNNATVGDSSSTEITVSWQPPLVNSCGVSGYKLRYVLTIHDMCSKTTLPTVSMDTVSTNVRLTGLIPASQYQVFVKATNSAGEGRETSVLWTTDDSVPTDPPQDIMVFLISGNNSIGFSWSQPSCGGRGGAIMQYSYRLTHMIDGLPLTDSTGDTAREWVVISGLVPFRQYSFQVAARTTVGIGPYSQIVQATIKRGQDANLLPTVTGFSSSAAENRMVTPSSKLSDEVHVTPKLSAKSVGSGSGITATVTAVVLTGLVLIVVFVVVFIKLRRSRGRLQLWRHGRLTNCENDNAEIETEMKSRMK